MKNIWHIAKTNQKWQKTDESDRKEGKMWSFTNFILPSSHFCPTWPTCLATLPREMIVSATVPRSDGRSSSCWFVILIVNPSNQLICPLETLSRANKAPGAGPGAGEWWLRLSVHGWSMNDKAGGLSMSPCRQSQAEDLSFLFIFIDRYPKPWSLWSYK